MSTCNRCPMPRTGRHAWRPRANAALLLGALALSSVGCAGDLGLANDSEIDDAPAFTLDLMLPDAPLGLGEAVLIEFGPSSTITKVYVRIQHSFLVSPIAERSRLEITITSINGIDHFHGTDAIPLTEIVEVDREDRNATGLVTWTEDNEPQVVGDVYTVCSTLRIDLPDGTRSGPERCQLFDPFA